MIYPSETDVVPFFRSLAKGLQPYAQANEVNISFSSRIKNQVAYYNPFLLSQSFVQLICNIVSLLPPKNKILVRLLCSSDGQNLQVEIENTGINLIRVNDVCTQSIYTFTGYPIPNGTIYRLVLPLQEGGFPYQSYCA
jgi:signal transduction histidine kinase